MAALLAAFAWEAEQAPWSTPPLATYRKYRRGTIAVYPYLEIWRLGEHVHPEPPAWPLLRTLEHLNVRIMYLTNDLFSSAREARLGKLNLLFLMMQKHHIDLGAAQTMVRHEIDHLISRFLLFRSSLDTVHLSEGTARYVDFLSSSLAGNQQALLVLRQRYGSIPNRDSQCGSKV